MKASIGLDSVEDAFTEWDENVSVPSGSQVVERRAVALHSHAREARAITPVSMKRRRSVTPESLEEAIRSVMEDEDDLHEAPARYAVAGALARS